MAVAVKNASETSAPSLMDRLAARSLLGVLYVLASICLVLYLLPHVWINTVGETLGQTSPVVNGALLLLAEVAAVVGSFWLGLRLLGAQPTPGLRAGIFWGLVALAVVAGLTWTIGMTLDSWLSPHGLDLVGQVVTAAVGLGLLGLAARWYWQPAREEFFTHFEEQGWLRTTPYKKSQGQRVRRGTMAGILVLVGAGIYTMIAHQLLRGPLEIAVPFTSMTEVRAPGDSKSLQAAFDEAVAKGTLPWVPRTQWESELEAIPDKVRIRNPGDSDWSEKDVVSKTQFEDTRGKLEKAKQQQPTSAPALEPTGSTVHTWKLWLLPDMQYTVPLILALGAIWFSYRLTNYPPFADFLIATEAELNKVSWTSRARLIQDTIVVLITLVLFTVFLFLVDAGWSWLLTRINVLPEVKAKVVDTNSDKQPW